MTDRSILDDLEQIEAAPAAAPVDLLSVLRGLAEDATLAVGPAGPGTLPRADSAPATDGKVTAAAPAPVTSSAAPPQEVERMPWPESWFSTNDPADGARCRHLWAAVLTSCLIGALTDRLDRKRRADVPESWIGSASFHMICEMAGFDSRAIEDRVRDKMATDEGAEYLRRDLSGRLPRSLHAQRDALSDGEA